MIRNALTQNTKAILLVHLAGWPCEMKSIMSLAKEKDLKVIEDCAQATGAKFNNQVVGTFGDIGSHSFCQDKIISTGGEGGMLVTSDEGLWSKLWSLKDHGKSYSAVYSAQNGKASHSFRWLHESIGTNARMTEMQAAIGLHQIKRLSRSLERRRKNAERLTSFFSDIPALRVPIPGPEFYHAYYKYYVFVKPERYRPGWSHKNILDAINAEGVPCFAGSCSEVYREKAFLGHSMPEENRLPVAQELGQTALMFQVHPTLSSSDIEDICAATEKVLSVALDQAC